MLKLYCQERNIKIRYATPYIYKENKMIERYWRTLAIIKNILFINNDLPVNFWAKTIDISNIFYNKLLIKCSKCIVILKKDGLEINIILTFLKPWL